MMRRAFLWVPAKLTGMAALSASAAAGARPRGLLLQTSPVAEFQYHNGEEFPGLWSGKFLRQDRPQTYGEKLFARIARIVELKDKSNSWEWEWERVRFEVFLGA